MAFCTGGFQDQPLTNTNLRQVFHARQQSGTEAGALMKSMNLTNLSIRITVKYHASFESC